MLISKDFTFEAAHYLTDYQPPKDKQKKLLKKGTTCEHLHGHTYHLRITVSGKVQKNGLVIDFLLLKKIVQEKVLIKLDHSLLNDIIKNPSAENITMWIWEKLEKEVRKYKVTLNEIELKETETSRVVYRGE